MSDKASLYGMDAEVRQAKFTAMAEQSKMHEWLHALRLCQEYPAEKVEILTLNLQCMRPAS